MSEDFKRDKSIYENYVCPTCFHQMDKCTCEVYPKYHIIWIDKGIQEHIRILNEKGYSTEYSCESHNPKNIIYVNFSCDYGIGKTIPVPEGFNYIKNSCQLEHKYDKKMNVEDFEVEKEKYLSILLEWCKNLPNKN